MQHCMCIPCVTTGACLLHMQALNNPAHVCSCLKLNTGYQLLKVPYYIIHTCTELCGPTHVISSHAVGIDCLLHAYRIAGNIGGN